MALKLMVLSAAILLAPFGCGNRQDVASVGSQTPHPVQPGTIRGPYVQAGALFSIKLDRPIDTFSTQPGTPFTAQTTAPLRGEDGRVLVALGARVRGVVASIGTEDTPLIGVQLESIDTIAGPVPLRAAVRTSQHYSWTGPPTPQAPYGSEVYPFGFTNYGSATWTPQGAIPGRPAEGRAMMQPREIDIPAGALLQLQLIEPLVLPGAQLTR